MKIIIASLALALGLTVTNVQAQTLPSGPLSILTNLPSVSLSAETFALSVGTVMHGASTFESSLAGEFVIHTNFAIAGEILTGTGSTAVDAAGLYFKIRKPWDAYEIYGLMGGRRNFSPGTWQGIAGFGAAWNPGAGSTTQNLLTKATIFAEQRLVISSTRGQPGTETVAGLKWPF